MLGSSYLLLSGGWAMLKHSEKYWLSIEALSKSLVTVVPFLTNTGIETLFLFSILSSLPEMFWAKWIEMTLGLPHLLHDSVSDRKKALIFLIALLSSNSEQLVARISQIHLKKDSLTSPVSTKSQSVLSIKELTLEKSKSAWACFKIILFPILLTVGLLVLFSFIFTSSPKCPCYSQSEVGWLFCNREELVTTAKSIHEVLPVGLMWVWPSTTCWNEKLRRMVQRWENRKWEWLQKSTLNSPINTKVENHNGSKPARQLLLLLLLLILLLLYSIQQVGIQTRVDSWV